MTYTIIDDASSLASLLDSLSSIEGRPKIIYVHLEGNNISRKGTLSLITILVPDQQDAYLIDVTRLATHTFTVGSSTSRTLRHILEDETIIKVFFDVRNDSDALHGLHGIRLKGVEDLQLIELASRSFSKRYVNGLSKCIEQDAGLSWTDKREWVNKKNEGRKLVAPERGGSSDVFDRRPLAPEIAEYCVQDVLHMPRLRKLYRAKLCDAWWTKIIGETEKRLELSLSPDFNGQGRHMALGPPSWIGWQPTVQQRGLRTMLRDDPVVDDLITDKASERIVEKADIVTIRTGLAQLTCSSDPGTTRLRLPTNAVLLEYFGRLHPSINIDRGGDQDSSAKTAIGNAGNDSKQEAVQLPSDEEEAECYSRYSGSFTRSSSRRSNSPEDFAACDRECGYCGRCMY